MPVTRRSFSRRRLLAGSAVAVGALSAPVAAQDATPPAASPVPTDPLGSVTPARVALVVDRLPAIAQGILDATDVPGMAIAVVHDDAVAYVGGFGVRELGIDAPIDADTVFQLASVSKPIAATVVSAVVGDGAISWDSRVNDIDPGFALHDSWPTQEVTLADLFAHRSGLREHGGDLLEDLGFGRDEVIHRLRYLAPEYSFRGGYRYTNFGLTAAAVAAARAAGIGWEDLSAERLYRPLGMTHTSARFADYMAQANRAFPHVKDGTGWIVSPTQRDPDAQTPAGGVSSTARDLAQWVRLQLGQGTYGGTEVIPAAALAPTHVPHAVSNPPGDPAIDRAGFYGLGWNVGYDGFGAVRWSHSGAFALGAGTAVYLLPGAGFGVLVLTNGFPVGAAEALCLSAVDLAQQGEVSQDWLTLVAPYFAAQTAPAYGTAGATAPASPAPALADEAYLGTYRNDYFGDAEVVRAGATLALRLGPQPREYPLAHHDRDTFTWQPPGENAPIPSALTFTVGADGVAASFADEYLASGGAGVLTRPAAAPE